MMAVLLWCTERKLAEAWLAEKSDDAEVFLAGCRCPGFEGRSLTGMSLAEAKKYADWDEVIDLTTPAPKKTKGKKKDDVQE